MKVECPSLIEIAAEPLPRSAANELPRHRRSRPSGSSASEPTACRNADLRWSVLTVSVKGDDAAAPTDIGVPRSSLATPFIWRPGTTIVDQFKGL